jgi:hypothetical protein
MSNAKYIYFLPSSLLLKGPYALLSYVSKKYHVFKPTLSLYKIRLGGYRCIGNGEWEV